MFTLPPLKFSPEELSPLINSQTVDIHYNKHHQTYITNLNKLLETLPEVANLSIEELLLNLDKVPEAQRQAVLNNAGQVYNHNLYWQSITNTAKSQKFELSSELGVAIDSFESYENFLAKWKEAGLTQFGSGWVWLSVDSNGQLSIDKTSNADSPLLHGKTPIMTMDVWEHAYYLDYQNRRGDYIDAFVKLIDWEQVSINFAKAIIK
jgi:superoxide dismutase, Fe-Mn family